MFDKIVKFLSLCMAIALIMFAAAYVAFEPEIANIRWHLDNCDTAWVSNDTLMLSCNNAKIVIGSQTEIFVSMTR